MPLESMPLESTETPDIAQPEKHITKERKRKDQRNKDQTSSSIYNPELCANRQALQSTHFIIGGQDLFPEQRPE
jgi:hypothetical protein